MSDLRKAAQQALEAMEGGGDSWRLIGPAIDALRAALEQQDRAQRMRDAGYIRRPTLREMAALEQSVQDCAECNRWQRAVLEQGELIEQLKAALLQQEQEPEPVAWRTFDGEGGYDYRTYDDNENYRDEWDRRNPNHKGWVEPLYTHPPRRKWRGLTDEEIDAVWEDAQVFNTHYDIARAIEAKLKELNHE
jgi:hypothetical protein